MPTVKIEKFNQVTQKWEEEEVEDSYLRTLEAVANTDDIDEQVNRACDDIVDTSLTMMTKFERKIEKN